MNAPKMIAKLCKVIKFDKISQKMTEKMVHIYLKQNLFFSYFMICSNRIDSKLKRLTK